jgi:hypothetical protein
MSDFDPSQMSQQYPSSESNIPRFEQNTLPGPFTDFKESTELSSELKEIFSKGQEVLREYPILNSDIQRLESRAMEVVEYPENVALFGTTKKTLDREDLKRVQSVEAYEFKRNGSEREILKISVQSLKENSSATEYVRRIEEDYHFNDEKAFDKVNSSMQQLETRRNLNVSFIDQSKEFRKKANELAYKSIEEIMFSFEDEQERKLCAVIIKKTISGIYLSIADYRNPDRNRMFATEIPVPLKTLDNSKFDSLKRKLSTHVNGMKKDLD